MLLTVSVTTMRGLVQLSQQKTTIVATKILVAR